MKIVMFYHSLSSDWNHGNAHFLRGIVRELQHKEYQVEVYEPENAWSREHLLQDHGQEILEEFRNYYPSLQPKFYDPQRPNYREMVNGADVVLVHEWNSPEFIAAIGKLKHELEYSLFFHDTHHRAVSDPSSLEAYQLSHYDGALVFGEVIRRIYEKNRWTKRVWTWHEAADASLFTPNRDQEKEGDLVWIGNWGDEERTRELMEFLVEPVRELGIKARVYGVRYPEKALSALKEAGISFGGYLPNYKVPEVFSRYKLSVHIPRRPYVEQLPGIPTIRPFEALACGIPLICSPWSDSENLFRSGEDYLMAKDGNDMAYKIAEVLKSAQLAASLSKNGRETIMQRHTCRHRVEELEQIILQVEQEQLFQKE